ASNRLGVEFDSSDFSRSDFTEAEKTAKDKSGRAILTQVQEAIDENLGAEEEREWNWQALSNQVNKRWGLKTSDRQLKQVGKDNLIESLTEQAEKSIADVDLSGGRDFLEDNWGLRSICDWARLKFGIKLAPEELTGKDEAAIKAVLHERVRAL